MAAALDQLTPSGLDGFLHRLTRGKLGHVSFSGLGCVALCVCVNDRCVRRRVAGDIPHKCGTGNPGEVGGKGALGLQANEKVFTHTYIHMQCICNVLCNAHYRHPLVPRDYHFSLQQTQVGWHTKYMTSVSEQ